VPDAVIDEIRQRERNGIVELQHPRLRGGARVRILSGLFRDRLGLCAEMDGRKRVRISLKMLGSQRQVLLHSDMVEPVQKGNQSP